MNDTALNPGQFGTTTPVTNNNFASDVGVKDITPKSNIIPPTPKSPVTPKAPIPPASPVTPPALPQYYDNKTGLLTDLGKSKGLPEVNAPKTDTSTTDTSTTNPLNPTGNTDITSAKSGIDADTVARTDALNTFNGAVDRIMNGTFPLNPAQSAQITGLQSSFANLISQQLVQNNSAQGVANIRGYQTGSAEYDPMFQAKTIGTIVSAGIQKVADLNTELASKVGELTSAFQKDDYAMIKDKYDAFVAVQDKRDAQFQKTIDETDAAIKDAQTQANKVTDGINNIATEAAKNGADAKTLAAISSAGSISAAITAAGDSLQTATGQLGDYLQYKRDSEANGIVPQDYTTWKKADDARTAKEKASEAYATAFATAKGKAAGENAGGNTGGMLPVTGSNGITFSVPASVAPYVKISESGVKYIDASGLSAAEKGKIIHDAYNGGINPIPVITDASMALDVNNITDATLKLKDMRDTFTANTAESATQRNLYFAAAQTIAKKLQTDPNVVGLDIYQDAALDILKAMSGTKGFRGGTSMVEQVKASFPKATDTQDVVNQKIDNMQKLIDDRQTGLIGNPSPGDQAIIDAKNNENNLATNLNNIKTTNPTLWGAATKMFTSLNPLTGQPYGADDVLQAFPELGK